MLVTYFLLLHWPKLSSGFKMGWEIFVADLINVTRIIHQIPRKKSIRFESLPNMTDRGG